LIDEKKIGMMLEKSDLVVERLAAALREIDRPEVRERASALGAKVRGDGCEGQAADEIERRLRETAEEASVHPVLKLAEVRPAFTSSECVDHLPSPDPLERRRILGETSILEDGCSEE
jgi:hypothetical protein